MAARIAAAAARAASVRRAAHGLGSGCAVSHAVGRRTLSRCGPPLCAVRADADAVTPLHPHRAFSSLPGASRPASTGDVLPGISLAGVEGLAGRHFMRIDDLSAQELAALLRVARDLKAAFRGDLSDMFKRSYKPLSGESVAMIFQKRSTRTRVSTDTGMAMLGGHALFLATDDIQLGVNESIKDTAHVLSRFNSLILARVYGHDTVATLAQEASVPVINALSDMHHPLQTLADMMTLQERFGSTGLAGRALAWVGDGNNVLHDLMLAAPMLGMHMHIATPAGYEADAGILADTRRLAEAAGTRLLLTTSPREAVTGAAAVVTDTWVSMGEEEEAARRVRDFEGYQVTRALCEGAASPDWVFLHCLPRHPEEVADDVFYDTAEAAPPLPGGCGRSLIWSEAENRMWTVMALMMAMAGKA